MGNKPHKIKHQKNKALRKFTQIETPSGKKVNKVIREKDFIKPVNKKIAKEMVQNFKKEGLQTHLKNKPHHHKRTTPGSVDPDIPQVITGHEVSNKKEKRKNKALVQKSQDVARKELRGNYKKAA